MAAKTEWRRDNFLVSTARDLFQPPAINEAFGTDFIYWASPMEETVLNKMLDNSFCFGVYELADSSTEAQNGSNPRQIGLARLITDQVTFAYLTDVYITEENQGKGLGSFLIGCVNETLLSWPTLRGTFLLASKGDFYAKRLEMEQFDGSKSGVKWMVKKGPCYGL